MQLLSFVGMMLFLPGYFSEVKAPKTVHATLGQSVSVQCKYTEQYTGNSKYWCRKSGNSCQKIVQTPRVDLPARGDRVSIEDNHSLLHFTVTISNVSRNDIGVYGCGVTVRGEKDLVAPVNITDIASTSSQDLGSRSGNDLASSLIYVPFLISVILKALIFQCIILAIIWMYRRSRQHSEEGKAL